MKIAIVGGKLQGTEAVYLAKKAGYISTLIDINPEVMASNICDEFVCGDVINEDENVVLALKNSDIILPAMENLDVIKAIYKIAEKNNLLVAFDLETYMITSSKLKSDELFLKNDICAPRYYPDCVAPYIVKPVSESGSHGVVKVDNEEGLKEYINNQNYIIQEYLEGPSYSIEVIGNGINYRTYAATKIHMDDVFDCCQVTAPTILTKNEEKKFSEIALKIARIIELKGIMDVEVIHARGELKVLEIDARIPSQTPAVVLKSSGMNLLKELVDIKTNNKFPDEQKKFRKFSIYENYIMKNGEIHKEGEHIMAEARPLKLEEKLFGYDEVIWDYSDGTDFRGIFINCEDTEEELTAANINLKEELMKLL
ncbi:MAG: 3-methylornithine--L-lysine ligase PylC [Peptostreptococcaceae bacterium]|nr:3-methylornithine--L-lysine ligase PylC [Peptostreptococcaceae bacterium]